jgi:hypothetical protein
MVIFPSYPPRRSTGAEIDIARTPVWRDARLEPGRRLLYTAKLEERPIPEQNTGTKET